MQSESCLKRLLSFYGNGRKGCQSCPSWEVSFLILNIFISKLCFFSNKGFSHHLTFYSMALDWAILSTFQTTYSFEEETFEFPWLNGTAGNMRGWHQFLGQMEAIKDRMSNIKLTDRLRVELIFSLQTVYISLEQAVVTFCKLNAFPVCALQTYSITEYSSDNLTWWSDRIVILGHLIHSFFYMNRWTNWRCEQRFKCLIIIRAVARILKMLLIFSASCVWFVYLCFYYLFSVKHKTIQMINCYTNKLCY